MATIDEYLNKVRSRLERVSPDNLVSEVDAGALLVDIRPDTVRETEGTMPEAVSIDRNVLLWRLAPSSDSKSVDIQPGQRVIVFCNDGYASSIAAAELREVGVETATDLIGGYRAWKKLSD